MTRIWSSLKRCYSASVTGLGSGKPAAFFVSRTLKTKKRQAARAPRCVIYVCNIRLRRPRTRKLLVNRGAFARSLPPAFASKLAHPPYWQGEPTKKHKVFPCFPPHPLFVIQCSSSLGAFVALFRATPCKPNGLPFFIV